MIFVKFYKIINYVLTNLLIATYNNVNVKAMNIKFSYNYANICTYIDVLKLNVHFELVDASKAIKGLIKQSGFDN